MSNNLFQQNYFQLFNLPVHFDVDHGVLQEQYRELQRQFHPDNFASNDENTVSVALSMSSHINKAYSTLSDSSLRAIYLLGIKGTPVDLIHDTKFSHQFLTEQIELREQIDEAKDAMDFDKLEQIEADILITSQNLEIKISELFKVQNYEEIVESVKELIFYKKLIQVISNIFAAL